MIVVTGAVGFIGSCLVSKLNEEGFYDIIVVDDFSVPEKRNNLQGKKFSERVERSKFFNWLRDKHKLVQFVFHIGARTDTAEFNTELLNTLNLDYTKTLWELCCEFGLPIVYASSAATYGGGEFGYDDDQPALNDKLVPLNPYGISKNEFDKWSLSQETQPYFWVGLKFFNVYGPNEYHKGRMASVIYHAYRQIKQTDGMKLFRSHRDDYKDGEQERDFVYVMDVVDVMFYLMNHRNSTSNGIYNLGTGKARTFNDLANSVFGALNKPSHITYIDTPDDIRNKYQYYTEAKMEKLRSIGYTKAFTSLEDGVKDYVKNYLELEKYY